MRAMIGAFLAAGLVCFNFAVSYGLAACNLANNKCYKITPCVGDDQLNKCLPAGGTVWIKIVTNNTKFECPNQPEGQTGKKCDIDTANQSNICNSIIVYTNGEQDCKNGVNGTATNGMTAVLCNGSHPCN